MSLNRWKIVLPDAATNYILNPSAEAEDNYAGYGGATVTRQQGIAAWGEYSYKVAPTGIGQGIHLWAGKPNGTLQVLFAAKGVTGALSVLASATPATAVNVQALGGGWQLYQAVIAGTGTDDVYITNSLAETWYVDGIVYSAGARLMTYLDGTQPGCRWLGRPHRSMSVRDGSSRAGGAIYDLESDLHFRVTRVSGMMMRPENHVVPRVILPGGSIEMTSITARTMVLLGWLFASTLGDIHTFHTALVDALKPDRVPLAAAGRPQQLQLQYWGDARVLQLSAVYAGGLDDYGDPEHAFNMKIPITFTVGEPFWGDVIETTLPITTEKTGIARMVMGRIQGEWGVLGPPNQVNVYRNLGIRAITETDEWVYFGGDFFDFDADDQDVIVRYHKQDDYWEAPYATKPTGALPFVNAMLVLPDGRVVIAGNLDEIDGITVDNVAIYDEVTYVWAMLGDGLPGGPVRDLAFDSFTGDIYAVKATTQLYRLPFGSTTWESYGAPASGGLAKLAFVLSTDPQRSVWLYGGGAGLYRMDVNAAVPKWERITGPTTVTALGAGNAGELFVGGIQDEAFAIVINPDGATPAWNVLAAADTSRRVNALAFDRGTGWLYITGDFTRLGTLQAQACARYRAGLFYRMPIDLPQEPPLGLSSNAFHLGRDETASTMPVFPWLPPQPARDNRNQYIGFSTSGTATWPGGISTLTASVPGGAVTKPVIRITRTGGINATINSIYNRTTGDEIRLDLSLNDGETVTIDLVNLEIISSYNNFQRRVIPLPGSRFASFNLLPTGNQIDVRVLNDGATLSGVLRYRQKYHSFAPADIP